MPFSKRELPLVYSCSGCSNAAQTANQVALELDRRGLAEMSCIAGVGGDVRPLVRLAQSGRTIIALDGCALACARSCLERHDVTPDHYHQLQEYGVKKRFHEEFDPEQAQAIVALVAEQIRPVNSTQTLSITDIFPARM
jgi:uncharacterized metal-binding protein